MHTLESIDILRLLSYLPHRYPFLLIDRIIEAQSDERCIGIKNVTFNEPQFQGHFPGRPVMPGVLLIEGIAQTAGALCVHFIQKTQSPSATPSLVYFVTIDKAKFRKPVIPGDTLAFHLNKLRRRGNRWWYRGEAFVKEEIVCEAEISALLVHE